MQVHVRNLPVHRNPNRRPQQRPRRTHDQRHRMRRAVHVRRPCGRAMAPEPVLAQRQPVIGGIDDKRIRVGGHDPPHRVVYQRDLAEVVAQGGQVVGRAHQHGKIQPATALRLDAIIMRHRLRRDRPARDRIHGAVIIKRGKPVAIAVIGCRPMTVGRGKRHKGEIRACLTADEIDRLVGEEIHRMAGLLILTAVVDDAVGVERAHMPVLHRHPVIPAGAGGRGFAQMILAEQPGAVAQAPEPLGQGFDPGQRMPAARPVLHVPVVDPGMNPVLGWQHPGQNRGPAGRAEGVRAPGLVKAHPAGGQRIQIGAVDFRVCVASQGAGLLVVGHDQNDVRLRHDLSPPS